jgi:Uma2 family endonuclease
MTTQSGQTPTPQLAKFADLLRIPELQRRHEILDGEIVPKGLASGAHGLAQARISQLLKPTHRQPSPPQQQASPPQQRSLAT